MGAYFCLGAYKHDVLVVIKWMPIFMGCLLCVGAYYPNFMVNHQQFNDIHGKFNDLVDYSGMLAMQQFKNSSYLAVHQ